MTTTNITSYTDIRAALGLLTAPGQVVELRVIGVDGRANRTDSGYFDDMNALAKVAARYDGRATAVYVTLHPVMPALLARATNRMQEWAKTTTNDTEITCRRWLTFDTDPTRPAGISSTDEEHDAALARARAIRVFLRERGWPEPIYADSGNGGHLLYFVDLPADDGGLTQRILAAVAALFDDRLVKVDRTVYNPGRIWKMYGTLARKGDSTPDRPHRRACILEASDTVSVVPTDLLESLAGVVPPKETPQAKEGPRQGQAANAKGSRTHEVFDVEAYLRTHGVGFSDPVDYNDGQKWMLDACVWNNHTDKAAVVWQLSDGMICANCSHSSCEGKGWIDLREHFEPGYRAQKEEHERAYQERTVGGNAASGDTPKKAAKRPPQRDDLIALADDAELFHTPQGIPYATFAVGDHCETWRLTSRGFREWLAHRYYREHGGSANTQAVQDACTALAGRARYAGPEHQVFVRLAEHDGTIYLDLCDAAWRVVAIDADGWRIVNARDVPVRFRRTKGMLALPTPTDGVTLVTLRSFINLTDADWILFVAALIAALRPQGPYPALGVFGEQGSAKSTLVRIARSLIDPNAAALRTMPRDERDMMIAATNSWYLTFDNVSRIQDWQSDAFCRLATGGGFATRELYADDEETILDAQRPVIVNGITEFATRSDLLDRLIPLNLQTIPDDQRRSEEALWLAFEQVRPGIIGALLTAISTALRNLPTTRLTALPRMADFALWVAAAAPALGFTADDFLRAYSRNRAIAHELAVEASPVADNLIAFVKSAGQWEGRASALLAALALHVDEATRKQRGWPTDAARLSAELKRIAPNLRAVGVSVAWDRSQRARTIRLAWTRIAHEEDRGETASLASLLSHESDEDSGAKQNQHDATHDATEHNDADSGKGGESASHVKTSEGKGNDAGDAGDAEKPSRSSRTSRPITDRDLPNVFPGYREAAPDD